MPRRTNGQLRSSTFVGIAAIWTALLAVGCGASPHVPSVALPADPPVAASSKYTGQLHVEKTGEAKRGQLVLVHGLSAVGSRDFDPIVEPLAEHFEILRVDLPGFGRSPLANHSTTPGDYAELVAAVIAEHATPPVDVLGHSMGGAIGLQLAGTHPELIRRLVLVSVAGVLHHEAFVAKQITTPVLGNAGPLGQPVAGAMQRAIAAARALEPAPSVMQALLPNDAAGRAAFSLIVTNFAPVMPRVTAPTLLVWGDADTIAPPRTAHLLHDRIAAARLVLLPGIGHVPMAEAPGALASAVVEHLVAPEPLVAPARPPQAPRPHFRCDGQDDVQLTGAVRLVELRGCDRVHIVDATLDRLVADDAEVFLTNVEVAASLGPAITSRQSSFSVTGGSVRGQVALELDDSDFDVAGTVLATSVAPLVVREPSRILFSAATIDGPGGVQYVHGEVDLE